MTSGTVTNRLLAVMTKARRDIFRASDVLLPWYRGGV